MFNGGIKTEYSNNNITKSTPDTEISSDAGTYEWRAVWENIHTQGVFSLKEMDYHINIKKLMVAKVSQETFVEVSNVHVKLLSDNTGTVKEINNTDSYISEVSYSARSGFGLG